MKAGQESILKTAVAILLAGFVFAFFQLPFAGIDLLLDPVGFLLVFNGANGLRKLAGAEGRGFGPACGVALALVALTAVQLFAGGAVADVLPALRGGLEAALFYLLYRGFAALLEGSGRPGGAVAVTVALWVSMAVAAARAVVGVLRLAAGSGLPPMAGYLIEGSGYLAQVFLLVTFLLVFKLYKRTESL